MHSPIPVPFQVNDRLLFISPMRWLDYVWLDRSFGERFGRDDDDKPRSHWGDFEGMSFLHRELTGIYTMLVIASRDRDPDWSAEDIGSLALAIAERIDDRNDPLHESHVADWDATFAVLYRVAFGGLDDWSIPASGREFLSIPAVARLDMDGLEEITIRQLRSLIEEQEDADLVPVGIEEGIGSSQPTGEVVDDLHPTLFHHNRIDRFFGSN